ncbi:TPA: XRE family transcriptional regulator [Klebsiella pneumoniae subsp. pneumoniae]|jgi:predicted XRE-type DNA-binding protein|nr:MULTISPECIES: helix-turn-helix transcriptional regulator [Enterobacterales]HEP1325841.1 XRE family transcriptional regulator [Klebsiella pneumoniae subsp. pneumoniae]MBC4097548.1 XRE family transcriptional regulator [Klebsiella pneumoniae]MCD5644245.1 helix-turn-helix domain-containing protein [Klebsiella pneumoniae]MCF0398190.1 helix-turn-helix domain-containing protein [Klebsiella pneumoniae]HBX0648702.1 helix-turn-helix domain-containing protein [Klebsiella pneumoniae]
MFHKVSEPYGLFASDSVELNMVSLKSKLIIILTELIRDEGWSQKVAAQKLGVTQPRVSNLMNGQISKFAIDMLLEMLCRMGFVMDVSFRPHDKESPIDVTVKKAVV